MPDNEKHLLSIRFEAFNALNHPNSGDAEFDLHFPDIRPHQRDGLHAPIATRSKVPVLGWDGSLFRFQERRRAASVQLVAGVYAILKEINYCRPNVGRVASTSLLAVRFISSVAFLDRTNISIAGLQISKEYGLGNQQLG